MKLMKNIVLLVACFILSSCEFSAADWLNRPERVYRTPVPVEILDQYTFDSFNESFAAQLKERGVKQLENGRYAPTGEIASNDYIPQSYANEIRNRLDYRSFSNLLASKSSETAQLHNNQHWSSSTPDKYTLNTEALFLSCSYLVFATLDWNNNGVRDWLVILTQNHKADNALNLSFWLVITDPQSTGMLSATMLNMEERRGIAKATTYAPASAEIRLDVLRPQLKKEIKNIR